jgi:ketosteroid isomerase-like protein
MSVDHEAFAKDWIEAWNAHDLARILSHYAEDVVLTSPIAARRLADPRGTVRGKEALRAYFAAGLAARPALRFTLQRIHHGVGSLCLAYKTEDGRRAAETMEFNDAGEVARVVATYAS